MQMQIIIEHFLRDKQSHPYNLNQSDRILMVMLASRMGNKNECWPSLRTLLKDTGIGSLSTISKCIKKLQSSNILIVKERFKTNNRYFFDQVFINFVLQNCNRLLQICNRKPTKTVTDLYANNALNNKKNKQESAYAPVTSQSTSHKLIEEPININREVGIAAIGEIMKRLRGISRSRSA